MPAKKKAEEKKKAALAAKVAGWLGDLENGTARKREAAARKLGDADPAAGRKKLLELLAKAKSKTDKRVITKCLHHVADLEVLRRIATDTQLELNVGVISTADLIRLYEDLRGELGSPKLSAGTAKRRIEKLDLFDRNVASNRERDEAWVTAHRELLVAILDHEKVRSVHHDAARELRDRNDPAGWSTLIERWQERPECANAFDVFASWLRLHAEAEPTDALIRAALLDLRTSKNDPSASAPEYDDEDDEDDDEDDYEEEAREEAAHDLDKELAEVVDRVPEKHLRSLIAALSDAGRWPLFVDAVAKRFVAVTHDMSTLVTVLEEPALAAAHGHAAVRITNSSGVEGARLVMQRAKRLDASVIKKALQKLDASVAFDFLAQAVTEDESEQQTVYTTLLAVPSALRDPRWLEVAPSLPQAGREMLIAMARDPKCSFRTKAVDQLSTGVKSASGRMAKREAVYALGRTGHPHATLYLVDALDDPDMADGAPLIGTALAEVGDTRAIPILQKRVDAKGSKHAAFLYAAIEGIKARVSRIHADVLLAAAEDDDPVIADLARRAQEGDQDSAIVLEDALRDRGRL